MYDAEATGSIERSNNKIPRDTLEKLVLLTIKQPWLIGRQGAFLELFDLCKTTREQSLIASLLDKFHYLTDADVRKRIDLIRDKITNDWSLQPCNTKISAFQKSDYADSSEAVLYALKASFAANANLAWDTPNFISNFNRLPDILNAGDNVILLDDFIGSGETIQRRVKWLAQKIADKGLVVSIYVCSVSGMEKAIAQLPPIFKDYFVVDFLRRGISDSFEGESLIEALEDMARLESELCANHRDLSLTKFRFGYKKTEALYYRDGCNPPNNIFPIFWWRCASSRTTWRPILPRI